MTLLVFVLVGVVLGAESAVSTCSFMKKRMGCPTAAEGRSSRLTDGKALRENLASILPFINKFEFNMKKASAAASTTLLLSLASAQFLQNSAP